jgi:hypothetical protein
VLAENPCASKRETKSAVPPAPAVIMRMGLFGKSCADMLPAVSNAAMIIAENAARGCSAVVRSKQNKARHFK